VAGLEAKLEAARGELDEACEDLKKIELLQERDADRLRVEPAAAELVAVGAHRAAS
jgi:hypothetical protein